MASILIVEDEPLISMVLEEWIVDLGHNVVGPAATVAEAIGLIETNIIQAALLDVRLRNDKSDAVAQMLLDQSVPFAFTTGDTSNIAGEDFAGCQYIKKPYEFETIQTCLESLLAQSSDQS